MIEKFGYDTFFGRFLEVLKCVLYDKGSGLVARQRGPFPLERFVDAVHHKKGSEKRMVRGKEGHRQSENRRRGLRPREFHDLIKNIC